MQTFVIRLDITSHKSSCNWNFSVLSTDLESWYHSPPTCMVLFHRKPILSSQERSQKHNLSKNDVRICPYTRRTLIVMTRLHVLTRNSGCSWNFSVFSTDSESWHYSPSKCLVLFFVYLHWKVVKNPIEVKNCIHTCQKYRGFPKLAETMTSLYPPQLVDH